MNHLRMCVTMCFLFPLPKVCPSDQRSCAGHTMWSNAGALSSSGCSPDDMSTQVSRGRFRDFRQFQSQSTEGDPDETECIVVMRSETPKQQFADGVGAASIPPEAYEGPYLPLGCCLKSWPSSPRYARVCPPCDLLDTLNPRQLLGRVHPCGQARKARFQH